MLLKDVHNKLRGLDLTYDLHMRVVFLTLKKDATLRA